MKLFKTLFYVSIVGLAQLANADSFVVTRADDPAPDGCLVSDCSLREAFEASAMTPGADTIQLQTGTYSLTRGDVSIFGNVTLSGESPSETSIVVSGAPAAFRVTAASTFTLRSVRFVPSGGDSLVADNFETTVTLDNVNIPVTDTELVLGNQTDTGRSYLTVRNSRIRGIIGCLTREGVCEISDSDVGSVAAIGAEMQVRVRRSIVRGPTLGLYVGTAVEVIIEDCTIRDSRQPLSLLRLGTSEVPAVRLRRTRFVTNGGPILADRRSVIYLSDVEFRENSVSAGNLSQPSVLLAQDGPIWRIERALFIGNRGGGGLDGATVRLLAGGNVLIHQSTFVDNTFHADVPSGYGHTIGIYAVGETPPVLILSHMTLRKAYALTPSTTGSLLTVRGNANVRVFNSAFDGTCAFGGGGLISLAEGNVESRGATCGFSTASNRSNVFDLLVTPLGAYGGFTQSFLPVVGSPLRDAARASWCLTALDQRRHLRPVGGLLCDVGATESESLSDAIFANDFES